MIEIVPASPAHIGTVARRLRAIDALECSIFGRTPKQALRMGVSSSLLAWTAKVDGRPEAIFGASTVSLIEGLGQPWLLMTDDAAKHARALVKLGRQYSDEIQRHYRILQNRVHADNAVAIRWLKRLGYVIEEPEQFNGQPMRSFYRVRSDRGIDYRGDGAGCSGLRGQRRQPIEPGTLSSAGR